MSCFIVCAVSFQFDGKRERPAAAAAALLDAGQQPILGASRTSYKFRDEGALSLGPRAHPSIFRRARPRLKISPACDGINMPPTPGLRTPGCGMLLISTAASVCGRRPREIFALSQPPLCFNASGQYLLSGVKSG